MSAADFFADRDDLRAAYPLILKGLVSYDQINDKINQRRDTLFAVVETFDNDCPEDYHTRQVALFKNHDDASFVLQSLMKNDGDDCTTFHIELVRVY